MDWWIYGIIAVIAVAGLGAFLRARAARKGRKDDDGTGNIYPMW